MYPFFCWLRSALRENPDVIFVGEIRDTETASLALSAAETGQIGLFHSAYPRCKVRCQELSICSG